MAVHRKAPQCPRCGESYTAIHKKVNSAFTFIGDTFLRWEHECKNQMKRPDTLPDIQRIYNQYVKDPVAVYKDYGSGFTVFKDPDTGKKFKIAVTEVKPKVKKIKKTTFKPDII
jgi:hypothetical protein